MKLTRSDVESAAQHLGIKTDIDAVTLAEVRLAFSKGIHAAHPDTSGTSAFEAVDKIATLRAARDMLAAWVNERPNPDCPLCKGSGFTRPLLQSKGFSSRPCPRCSPV